MRADTAACYRLAELADWAILRPIVDPLLDTVRLDCSACRAQDSDPLSLYRPAVALARDGRVSIYCEGCSTQYAR